jgi:hypothetical protein
MEPKNLLSIILNVCIISSFIGIFFFTFGLKYEEKIVNEQIKYLVNDLTTDLLHFLPENVTTNLKDQLNNYKLPDMSYTDKIVEKSNKKLKKKASIAILALLSFCVLSTLYLKYKFHDKLTNTVVLHIFKDTFIILMVVALTEFIFLTLIGGNYMSIDPHTVKSDIITIIENNIRR